MCSFALVVLVHLPGTPREDGVSLATYRLVTWKSITAIGGRVVSLALFFVFVPHGEADIGWWYLAQPLPWAISAFALVPDLLRDQRKVQDRVHDMLLP